MRVKTLALALFWVIPVTAAPTKEGLAVQELRLYCQELDQKLHHQKIEMELLQEKILSLQEAIVAMKSSSTKELVPSSDKRLAFMEKTQEALMADFKTLKEALNETNATLDNCQKKWASIEKQWSQDLALVKNSLKSLLATTLNDPLPDNYTVKPGDSLEKIAHLLKIDLKKLKEMNHLVSDKIIVGQKLKIPK